MMIWQDGLVTFVNILFAYSLLHQVYDSYKKKQSAITLRTSGITFIGLYAIAFAFFTLPLYFSAFLTFVNGTLWLMLFVQGIAYKR